MTTAVLENINPYAKYGLKRRPTYDEIVGLVAENRTLFGQLPDRRATQFKASPEGSFFDGLEHLDILKAEQDRIHERQLRELMLRRNIGNQTYSIARLQQNTQTQPSSEAQIQSEGNTAMGLIQQQVQQRAQQALQRTQQTAEEHGRNVSQMGVLPIFSRLANLTPTSRQETRTQMRTTQQLDSSTDDEPELMTEEEMMTARGIGGGSNPPTARDDKRISYSTNISSMTAGELKFQLFLRGVDVDDPEINLPARKKGKGGGKTQKQFYQDMANELIRSGRWETRIEEQLLRSRIEEYNSKGARSSKS